MNAYLSDISLMEDDWYHTYWVWRDTPHCETNHDLSYMKSPDLKNWNDAHGTKVTLPATLDQRSLIVDPIPVDDQRRPALVITSMIAQEICSSIQRGSKISSGNTRS